MLPTRAPTTSRILHPRNTSPRMPSSSDRRQASSRRFQSRTVSNVEICLLGSLEVRDDDGNAVPLAGTRLQTLLIALALRCGEVVTDDLLIEAVWEDDAPAQSVNALQRQVSTLRRTLNMPDVVQRRGTGYVLDVERSAIDAFRFEDLASRGDEAMRNGDVEQARELLVHAMSLWRGDALADVAYNDFAQAE